MLGILVEAWQRCSVIAKKANAFADPAAKKAARSSKALADEADEKAAQSLVPDPSLLSSLIVHPGFVRPFSL
ncbi:MAG: hypothetical protein M3R59_06495 [Verrucomicrobiota bacterium]|nr:hypothetical protein [Verrucomicrobiota bacterium]